ncbi:pyridoxal phosphate-dependent aminotransferase [Guggenheimella bovis]
MLSKRAKAISPSITLSISARVKQMKADGIPVINLSIGEPDFPTPECAKQGGIEAIEQNMTKYDVATGNLELKKEIVRKLKEENGIDYETDQIVVSSGAKFSITNTILTTLNPGDEVIIPVPYWVSYPEIVELLGANAIYVKTKKENGFKLTLEDLEGKVTENTRMVIINNPSNPTGNVYTKEELLPICDYFTKKGILILADEIYERIVYDAEFTSIAALSEEIKNNTVIVNGLSKSASMTGWRIGYTACNKEMAKSMGSVQSHLVSHPSTVSMHAALFALRDCKSEIERMRQEYMGRRDMIAKFFKEELPEIQIIPPKGAFYVFIDISPLREKIQATSLSLEVCQKMLDREVAFVPGIGFGEDDFIRMSYAASREDITEGLQRFKAFVKEILK